MDALFAEVIKYAPAVVVMLYLTLKLVALLERALEWQQAVIEHLLKVNPQADPPTGQKETH